MFYILDVVASVCLNDTIGIIIMSKIAYLLYILLMSKVSVITSVDCMCGVYLAKASVRPVLIALKVRCGCCIALCGHG